MERAFDPSKYGRWSESPIIEATIPSLVERFGNRFMWASDFPHADHTPEYILDLDELAGSFDEADRAPFLGQNARELFAIPT